MEVVAGRGSKRGNGMRLSCCEWWQIANSIDADNEAELFGSPQCLMGVGIAIVDVDDKPGTVPCGATFPPAGTTPYFAIPCPAAGCTKVTTPPCPAPPAPPPPKCPPAQQGKAWVAHKAQQKVGASSADDCCQACLGGYYVANCAAWDYGFTAKEPCRLFDKADLPTTTEGAVFAENLDVAKFSGAAAAACPTGPTSPRRCAACGKGGERLPSPCAAGCQEELVWYLN